jgi:hypothetical protein
MIGFILLFLFSFRPFYLLQEWMAVRGVGYFTFLLLKLYSRKLIYIFPGLCIEVLRAKDYIQIQWVSETQRGRWSRSY